MTDRQRSLLVPFGHKEIGSQTKMTNILFHSCLATWKFKPDRFAAARRYTQQVVQVVLLLESRAERRYFDRLIGVLKQLHFVLILTLSFKTDKWVRKGKYKPHTENESPQHQHKSDHTKIPRVCCRKSISHHCLHLRKCYLSMLYTYFA